MVKEFPIEECDFTVRTTNKLKRAGITSLDKLLTYSIEDLKGLKNISNRTIEEIVTKLGESGLTLIEKTPEVQPIRIYNIVCSFNVSRILVDRAFYIDDDAYAYANEMNGDKAKAVARCKELIARYEGEAMVPFLDESSQISFDMVETELW